MTPLTEALWAFCVVMAFGSGFGVFCSLVTACSLADNKRPDGAAKAAWFMAGFVVLLGLFAAIATGLR